MMKYEIYKIQVKCDKCGMYLQHNGEEEFDEDEVDGILADEGWIETELGDICPDCIKNYGEY